MDFICYPSYYAIICLIVYICICLKSFMFHAFYLAFLSPVYTNSLLSMFVSHLLDYILFKPLYTYVIYRTCLFVLHFVIDWHNFPRFMQLHTWPTPFSPYNYRQHLSSSSTWLSVLVSSSSLQLTSRARLLMAFIARCTFHLLRMWWRMSANPFISRHIGRGQMLDVNHISFVINPLAQHRYRRQWQVMLNYVQLKSNAERTDTTDTDGWLD